VPAPLRKPCAVTISLRSLLVTPQQDASKPRTTVRRAWAQWAARHPTRSHDGTRQTHVSSGGPATSAGAATAAAAAVRVFGSVQHRQTPASSSRPAASAHAAAASGATVAVSTAAVCMFGSVRLRSFLRRWRREGSRSRRVSALRRSSLERASMALASV